MLLTLALVAAALTPAQKREVMQAVWSAFQERFYDPKMRGVDWAAVRDEYLRKAVAAENIEPLVFEMIARLRNSHSGLAPPDRKMFPLRLPFYFDRACGRTYVTAAGAGVPLEYGDEVVSVDGRPARELRAPVRSNRSPRRTHPYYGAKDSVAVVAIRRRGATRVLEIPRVRAQPSPVAHDLGDGAVHFRLFPIQKGAELPNPRALVLDLRHCEGGWLEGGLEIMSWLLGPGRVYNTIVPWAARATEPASSQEQAERLVSNGMSARLETFEPVRRFAGPVALLVNWNTGSECEILAAALKEHGRVRVFGTRTEGAFNGWSETYELPYGVGTLAIPYTGSRSPRGIDYEGRGVEPDEEVAFDPERDAALERAVRWLRNVRPGEAGWPRPTSTAPDRGLKPAGR